MKRLFCLVAAAAIPLCLAPAQAQTSRSVSPDTRFDTLRPDSGFQDWRRLNLEGGARPTDIGAAYAYALPGDPLGGNSPELVGGYWRPLSQRLSSLVETSVIPGAGGTGERSVLGQLATQFGKGWGLQAGLRHSDVGVPMSESLNGRSGLGDLQRAQCPRVVRTRARRPRARPEGLTQHAGRHPSPEPGARPRRPSAACGARRLAPRHDNLVRAGAAVFGQRR